MSKVAFEIAKAIKESKWLYIHYKNVSDELTYYWCAVLDVEVSKRLKVDIFNYEKSSDTMSTRISFSRILHAEVLEGTFYDVPLLLVNELKVGHDKYKWLYFEQDNQYKAM